MNSSNSFSPRGGNCGPPMHELSVIASLFETIETLAGENGAKAVTGVWIKAGALSGVVPELLESAFDIFKQGTIAAGANLTIKRPPLTIQCRTCRTETAGTDFILACPACSSSDLHIVEGTDLVLERIELETDGPADPEETVIR